jgi:hypothetical protein
VSSQGGTQRSQFPSVDILQLTQLVVVTRMSVPKFRHGIICSSNDVIRRTTMTLAWLARLNEERAGRSQRSGSLSTRWFRLVLKQKDASLTKECAWVVPWQYNANSYRGQWLWTIILNVDLQSAQIQCDSAAIAKCISNKFGVSSGFREIPNLKNVHHNTRKGRRLTWSPESSSDTAWIHVYLLHTSHNRV